MRTRAKILRKLFEDLTQQLRGRPTMDVLMEAYTQVTGEKMMLLTAQKILKGKDVSIDDPLSPDKEELRFTPEARVPAADDIVIDREDRARVRLSLLTKLSPEEQFVINANHGIDREDGRGLSNKEIGEELGVSRETVRKIDIQAMLKLKLALGVISEEEYRVQLREKLGLKGAYKPRKDRTYSLTLAMMAAWKLDHLSAGAWNLTTVIPMLILVACALSPIIDDLEEFWKRAMNRRRDYPDVRTVIPVADRAQVTQLIYPAAGYDHETVLGIVDAFPNAEDLYVIDPVYSGIEDRVAREMELMAQPSKPGRTLRVHAIAQNYFTLEPIPAPADGRTVLIDKWPGQHHSMHGPDFWQAVDRDTRAGDYILSVPLGQRPQWSAVRAPENSLVSLPILGEWNFELWHVAPKENEVIRRLSQRPLTLGLDQAFESPFTAAGREPKVNARQLMVLEISDASQARKLQTRGRAWQNAARDEKRDVIYVIAPARAGNETEIAKELENGPHESVIFIGEGKTNTLSLEEILASAGVSYSTEVALLTTTERWNALPADGIRLQNGVVISAEEIVGYLLNLEFNIATVLDLTRRLSTRRAAEQAA
jgi:RNA polymerase sigma factor (sigma-70 family)